MISWKRGRQNDTGYRVLTLIRSKFPIPFDIHIIHYPRGASLGLHRDPNSTGRHYRLNLELWRGKGGDFICDETIVNWKRLHIFRPDINAHGVTEVTEGTRVVFSLGWIWGKYPVVEATDEELGRWESEGGR